MELIDSHDAAEKLARAIAADVGLYNGPEIAAGQIPQKAIDEGRELYRSRVTETWYPLFETAVAAELKRDFPQTSQPGPGKKGFPILLALSVAMVLVIVVWAAFLR